MAQAMPNTDGAPALVKAALSPVLAADPAASVRVEYGVRDALHVIATSALFQGLAARERNEMVRDALRGLDPEILLRITVVMLLTPEEYQEMLEHRRLFADA